MTRDVSRVPDLLFSSDLRELGAGLYAPSSDDVSEMARLRDELDLTRTIIGSAADGILMLDSGGRTTFANPAAEKMFGWTRAELEGRKLHDVVHYKHIDGSPFPMSECALGRVFETGETLQAHEDLFFAKDGGAVPVACSNAAIVRDGRIVGSVLVVRDITERRRAEEHRQLLVNELNHRVKNTLSIIQSIARQSFRQTGHAVERGAFEARLAALSAAHDLLTAGNWESAPIGALVQRATAPFQGEGERIEIGGPDLQITPKAAVGLSMALHELSTNAAKYGALSTGEGLVRCAWSVQDASGGALLCLTWTETGGPAVAPPTRRGFGSRMIEGALAGELGGEVRIHYEPSGLRCELEAPLAENVVGLGD